MYVCVYIYIYDSGLPWPPSSFGKVFRGSVYVSVCPTYRA